MLYNRAQWKGVEGNEGMFAGFKTGACGIKRNGEGRMTRYNAI